MGGAAQSLRDFRQAGGGAEHPSELRKSAVVVGLDSAMFWKLPEETTEQSLLGQLGRPSVGEGELAFLLSCAMQSGSSPASIIHRR